MLLNAINIVIEYRNFDLDEGKFDAMPKEEKNDLIDANELFSEEYFIIIFLDGFLEEMPTRVAKNWFRFASYFRVRSHALQLFMYLVLETFHEIRESVAEFHARKRFNSVLL